MPLSWEFAASFSFLHLIQSQVPRGGGSDNFCWSLNGSGKFDTWFFYHKIWDFTPNFPWKGIWKVKVPKRVAFFIWTAAHGQILTSNNLMLHGLPLANHCCMCCCNEKSVAHLLIFCLLAHSMWMHMLKLFGIDWVMSGSVADLLCCWHHWLGKYNSNIWNLVSGCLMRTIWTERNRRSFEDIKKSPAQLLDLCQRTLFKWSWGWGLSDCSTIIDFLLSLRISFWFLYFFLFSMLFFVHYRELCVSFLLFY